MGPGRSYREDVRPSCRRDGVMALRGVEKSVSGGLGLGAEVRVDTREVGIHGLGGWEAEQVRSKEAGRPTMLVCSLHGHSPVHILLRKPWISSLIFFFF